MNCHILHKTRQIVMSGASDFMWFDIRHLIVLSEFYPVRMVWSGLHQRVCSLATVIIVTVLCNDWICFSRQCCVSGACM
jgi:hypothetical protein